MNVLYGVFRQISELSVDVESKQKELQRLQQEKSGVEEQLGSLVRRGQSLSQQDREKKEKTKKMTKYLIGRMGIKMYLSVGNISLATFNFKLTAGSFSTIP